MSFQYAVAVVLDVDFGEQLFQLASRMPVWIVDTPTNRAAAEKQWAESPGRPHTDGVTTFKVDSAQPVSMWLEDVLPMVDLHHGEHSHDPAYDALEVVGVSLTADVKTMLASYELTEFRGTATGFIVFRSRAEA